jgi:hypothetical protein
MMGCSSRFLHALCWQPLKPHPISPGILGLIEREVCTSNELRWIVYPRFAGEDRGSEAGSNNAELAAFMRYSDLADRLSDFLRYRDGCLTVGIR